MWGIFPSRGGYSRELQEEEARAAAREEALQKIAEIRTSIQFYERSNLERMREPLRLIYFALANESTRTGPRYALDALRHEVLGGEQGNVNISARVAEAFEWFESKRAMLQLETKIEILNALALVEERTGRYKSSSLSPRDRIRAVIDNIGTRKS